MSDNTSFVLNAVENVSFEQRPIPEIGDGEILVEVKKTGICGSDVHYLVEGRIGDFIVKKPMVLGHESSGVVCKVGSKVKSHKVGDRVAIEPGAACFNCDYCKSGVYELCEDMVFAATPPYDGTLGRFYKVPSHNAYVLPEGVSLEDGALMEPLSVGVHAVSKLGGFRTNQSIAVFGCGPVGILCMAVAKALGANRIIAVDIVQERLAFAQSYIGAETYLPPPPNSGESKVDFSKRNADLMKEKLGIKERGPTSIDLVVDASGAEVSLQTGLHIAKMNSTFVQVGMGHPNVTIDLHQIMLKQMSFKGSFRYGAGDYPLAVALVAQGRVNLKPLVTHRFSFKDAEKAFQVTRQGKSEDGKGVIKVMISGPDVPAGPL